MSDLSTAAGLAASGMTAQSGRLRHIAENVANADTPGYQRKIATFQPEAPWSDPAEAVRTGPVQLDRTEAERVYDPAHPLADDGGYYTGSNVDLVTEITDAREAQRSYEANLNMLDRAREMKRGLIGLLQR